MVLSLVWELRIVDINDDCLLWMLGKLFNFLGVTYFASIVEKYQVPTVHVTLKLILEQALVA